MKTRKTRAKPNAIARAHTVDRHAVRELFLWITSSSDIYKRNSLPAIANLKKKWKKGVYDRKLARKLWEYTAEIGAKDYYKNFGWNGFPPLVRSLVASKLEDYYREHVME